MCTRFVIALDDLLNDFSEMLEAFGMGQYDKNDPVLRQFVYDIKNGCLTDRGRQIMVFTHVDANGLQFFDWITRRGFTVLICTDRDLRFSYRETEKWLKMKGISHSGLFAVDDPIEFCQKIGARYFLFGLPKDKHLQGSRFRLFSFSSNGLEGSDDFTDFGGVKQWTQKNGF